ncbi:hypothetical protein R6258_18840, partial [Halomonas sp. HP20-15]|uniref:hypothetical protein n=1 Tax=Halomonas sp. HP20-15 TaxID=3085901 RepID=UPI002980FE87
DIDMLVQEREPGPGEIALAALAALGLMEGLGPETGFTLWQPMERDVLLRHGGRDIPLRVRSLSGDAHDVMIGPGIRR